MPYENPGQSFIEEFGEITSADGVLLFAEYLRRESGLTVTPPIDLGRIYDRFGIPLPKRQPLPNLQGLLVDPEGGIILINDHDFPLRQRFTEAHELMEVLFSALTPGKGWAARQRVGVFKQQAKEKLCNAGAAELLMPRDSFGLHVRRLGVSQSTARQLAILYQVSTTASLVQMVRVGPGCHAIVLWRMKNKPTEMRKTSPANQLSLSGMLGPAQIPQKLRVEWAFGGPGAPYIPMDKSVPEDSSIHCAWKCGTFTTGEDHLDLGGLIGTWKCENQPSEMGEQRCVASLLHAPGDSGCCPAER